ncbi:phosphoribosyl 1,2-cyclic phosphate phosphodiesterase [Winogradskyella epiphytica]|uniref:Phosphoribosyl 1,2-cyclic phosphate phosphodiesterase n=1 Tax=Winogradskyella epiphytica TaxID=262005 RepID=A0A2V4XJI4_9FLAO|nr:MBL fold metallo-hydrolase [Winogradskyella epiphytica]PYE81813.1 phosphoribosyl 1,2-cyclic phosphate phosphodiesterase [Winogradskyella epiphytica]GGW62434.1 MBL fold metallo-hydrolase [Winogradskyella epiphytica]
MKITFLGTGTSQGIPIIGSDHPVCLSENQKDKRLRVSVLVEWDNYTYVIDCGPDFRQQMLNAKVSRIDGIIFTHEHADHTMGLDDIRPFFFRQGDIPLYAHERVFKALERRFDYIFTTGKKYPGVPSVTKTEIKNEPFIAGNLNVIPINGWHYKLQVFGYRFRDFAYLTDMKTIEEAEIDKLHNLEVLVVNALRKEPHMAHFNLEEALELIERVKPRQAYLTHISHHMGFHDEVQKELPENVFLAYDNLQITI